MSGNVFIVCLTVVICALILAFCHWQEHHADISDDRYQYLCGHIEDIRKEIKSLNLWCDQLQDNMQITDRDIAAGFDERDHEIMVLDTRITAIGKLFDGPNGLDT